MYSVKLASVGIFFLKAVIWLFKEKKNEEEEEKTSVDSGRIS